MQRDNSDIWHCDGMTFFLKAFETDKLTAWEKAWDGFEPPPALTGEVTANSLVIHCVANECKAGGEGNRPWRGHEPFWRTPTDGAMHNEITQVPISGPAAEA